MRQRIFAFLILMGVSGICSGNEYPHHQEYITLGGITQSIMIIGDTTSNKPVLLYLHGHAMPGALFAYSYYETDTSLLSKNFIIVHWDQRGAGRSYSKDIDPETMNIPQYVSDANELTDILLKRFNKEKLYLFGQSWGSMLGMKLVHNYPQKFYCYISEGQVSDMQATYRHMYDYIFTKATTNSDKKILRKMRKIEPPDSSSSSDKMAKFTRKAFRYYEYYIFQEFNGKSFLGFFKTAFKNSPDFEKFRDKIQVFRGLFFTMENTGDELLNTNLNYEIESLELPWCMILGEYDFMRIEAEKFYHNVEAPYKEQHIIENTAHAPSVESSRIFEEIFMGFIERVK